MSDDELKALVRTISDFPKPGIQFRDITTLLANGPGLRATIDRLAALAGGPVDLIAGIEARGFILGAALAVATGAGFLPIRKAGKLPGVTIGIDYALEYGTDRLEIHVGQVAPGARVILIDDLIATGGTARAAARLLEGEGAELVKALFVIDLPALGGLATLRQSGIACDAVMEFTGH